MGCDYYADENGEFELEIGNFNTSKVLGTIVLTGLKPAQKLSEDLLKGRAR